MEYLLRPGVTACRTGGFTFFLDVHRDRYFAIGGTSADAFDRLVGGAILSPTEISHLDALAKDGLLCRSPGAEAPRYCERSPRPHESALDLALDLALMPPMTAALFRYVLSRRSLRRAGLAGALDHLERRKGRIAGDVRDRSSVAHIAAAFERCNALVSPLDQCLPRSIAIAHRLIDHGIKPILVMGVRAQPFAAHCWVEAVDLIVSDRRDTIRAFTPILTL